MDKKNTMLLTVIAVATLLVAVVGATFAYFTSTATNDNQTTVVTANAETVAAVGLTNPTSTLSLKLTAADMAQVESAYRPYWATNSTTENYDLEAVQRSIAVATVGAGGSETARYTCTANINIALAGDMAGELEAEDAYVQFGGLLTDKVDLTQIATDGYPVTFNLDGTDVKEQSVTAAVAIANRDADQTDLAGKTLTVTFSNTDFTCQVVAE